MEKDFAKHIIGGVYRDCIEIKIDNESFICLIERNGDRWIEAKINKFFHSDKKEFESSISINRPAEGKEYYLEMYSLATIIDNLRVRILKQLAKEGLFGKIDKAIDARDNPKERVLSEFDKNILKAVNYNPNKKPDTE